MTQIYTEEKLIQYYYAECDLFETLEIEDAMSNNFDLYETFHYIKEGLDTLPTTTFSPSNKTIFNILQYSKTGALLS